jgi:peptidoglycan LD-endopeptidase LytH
MYESLLFDNVGHRIDGYAGQRTLHVGLDLDGPLGTPVHAFCAGRILHVGYNPALGDYGHVVVVQHDLPLALDTVSTTTPSGSRQNDSEPTPSVAPVPRVVYALYGHLDEATSRDNRVGDTVVKGQVLGRMGDIDENGGWFLPHVHLQLSIHPPDTHDLPGAVALADRDRAMLDYPDPRYIVGPLY